MLVLMVLMIIFVPIPIYRLIRTMGISIGEVRVSEFFMIMIRVTSGWRLMVIMVDVMTIMSVPGLQFFLLPLVLHTVKWKQLFASLTRP